GTFAGYGNRIDGDGSELPARRVVNVDFPVAPIGAPYVALHVHGKAVGGPVVAGNQGGAIRKDAGGVVGPAFLKAPGSHVHDGLLFDPFQAVHAVEGPRGDGSGGIPEEQSIAVQVREEKRARGVDGPIIDSADGGAASGGVENRDSDLSVRLHAQHAV